VTLDVTPDGYTWILKSVAKTLWERKMANVIFLAERVLAARTVFPSFRKAECLVVAGREDSLDKEQARSR